MKEYLCFNEQGMVFSAWHSEMVCVARIPKPHEVRGRLVRAHERLPHSVRVLVNQTAPRVDSERMVFDAAVLRRFLETSRPHDEYGVIAQHIVCRHALGVAVCMTRLDLSGLCAMRRVSGYLAFVAPSWRLLLPSLDPDCIRSWGASNSEIACLRIEPDTVTRICRARIDTSPLWKVLPHLSSSRRSRQRRAYRRVALDGNH